jgi:hypothetical protein
LLDCRFRTCEPLIPRFGDRENSVTIESCENGLLVSTFPILTNLSPVNDWTS